MNPKTFCIIPWAHTRFNPNGRMRPCCKIDIDWSGNKQLNDIEDFDQYWNSEEMQQLRLDLSDGIQNKNCHVCWKDEAAGKPSLRQEYNQQLGKYVDLKKIHKNNTGHAEQLPIALDLNLSNICNYKCVMCSPDSSSRIAQEHRQHETQYRSLDFVRVRTDLTDQTWPEQDFFQNLIAQIAPNLKIIELKGGEPLLVKNVKSMIQAVENKSECTIAITTNGSVDLDNDFLESLTKFKKIWLFVSVDGIGEVGEYIRFGSKWSQVENVIKQASSLPNCVFRMSMVLQFFSPVTFPDIFQYSIDNNFDLEILPCTWPPYLGINAIPVHHRNDFVDWVDSNIKQYPDNISLKTVKGYFNNYSFDQELFNQCQQYLEMLDNIRNNKSDLIQKLFK